MTAPQTPARPSGALVIDFGRLGSKLGLALGAIGLLVVGIGWNGAASNDLSVEQFPYLLSGGILGLSLVVMGAAYTITQNAREDSARLEARLAELIEVVASSGGLAGGTPAPQDLSNLVAAGTASYHSPSCRLVDGREATTYLTPDEAMERGLKACRVCKPAVVDAPPVTLG